MKISTVVKFRPLVDWKVESVLACAYGIINIDRSPFPLALTVRLTYFYHGGLRFRHGTMRGIHSLHWAIHPTILVLLGSNLVRSLY
ncbi:hypothetical protein AB3S75_039836 [Citrus x aurantiifolia]